MDCRTIIDTQIGSSCSPSIVDNLPTSFSWSLEEMRDLTNSIFESYTFNVYKDSLFRLSQLYGPTVNFENTTLAYEMALHNYSFTDIRYHMQECIDTVEVGKTDFNNLYYLGHEYLTHRLKDKILQCVEHYAQEYFFYYFPLLPIRSFEEYIILLKKSITYGFKYTSYLGKTPEQRERLDERQLVIQQMSTSEFPDVDPDILELFCDSGKMTLGYDTNYEDDPDEIVAGCDFDPDQSVGGCDFDPHQSVGGCDFDPDQSVGGCDFDPDQSVGGCDFDPDQSVGGCDFDPDQSVGGFHFNPKEKKHSKFIFEGINIERIPSIISTLPRQWRLAFLVLTSQIDENEIPKILINYEQIKNIFDNKYCTSFKSFFRRYYKFSIIEHLSKLNFQDIPQKEISFKDLIDDLYEKHVNIPLYKDKRGICVRFQCGSLRELALNNREIIQEFLLLPLKHIYQFITPVQRKALLMAIELTDDGIAKYSPDDFASSMGTVQSKALVQLRRALEKLKPIIDNEKIDLEFEDNVWFTISDNGNCTRLSETDPRYHLLERRDSILNNLSLLYDNFEDLDIQLVLDVIDIIEDGIATHDGRFLEYRYSLDIKKLRTRLKRIIKFLNKNNI